MSNEYADPTLQAKWDNKVADFEEKVWAKMFTEIGLARLIEESPHNTYAAFNRIRMAEIRTQLIRLGAWR